MRSRQMVVRWLMANTKAIETRQRDGKTFYVMVDAKAFREGVGRLLAEVQRIKGTGDYAAANLLMILGRGDFIPVDSWALKVVSKEWHNGQPIGRPQVEAAFATWGEWKGLAYWFWNYA